MNERTQSTGLTKEQKYHQYAVEANTREILKTKDVLRAERDDFKRRYHESRRNLRAAGKALEVRSLMVRNQANRIHQLLEELRNERVKYEILRTEG